MIEPGLVAASLLVATSAIHLVGSLLARKHFRALNEIADRFEARDDLTEDDRESLDAGLREATRRWPVWILAILAPLWCIPFLIAAIVEVARNWGVSEEEQDRRLKAEMEHYRAILDEIDRPKHSAAYNEVYLDFMDHIFYSSAKSAPLASLWIILWALPGLGIFAAAGAADMAAKRFRMTFEASVRWITEPRFV